MPEQIEVDPTEFLVPLTLTYEEALDLLTVTRLAAEQLRTAGAEHVAVDIDDLADRLDEALAPFVAQDPAEQVYDDKDDE